LDWTLQRGEEEKKHAQSPIQPLRYSLLWNDGEGDANSPLVSPDMDLSSVSHHLKSSLVPKVFEMGLALSYWSYCTAINN